MYDFQKTAVLTFASMKVDTTKLTIRLPREDVEIVKSYTHAQGVTVTEVAVGSSPEM